MAVNLGYLVVGAVGAATTYATTPIVRWVALRWNLVAEPGDRRVHESAIPDIGGIAMYLGVLAAMGTAWRMGRFHALYDGSSEPLAVLIGASIMLLVGVIDDIKEISPPAKLSGMVLAASALYLLGVTLFNFRAPFLGVTVLGPDWAPLVTVLWVLGMANAVNFIDGLDGLAAGIVAIASFTLFLYGTRLLDAGLLDATSIGPLIAIIACGVCVGFLPHNRHPARIFMGDGGALLLGLLMAAATIVIGGRANPSQPFSGQTYFFLAPLFIPLFILGVPIIDTVFAIIRRATQRSSPAARDLGHLHHRLMRLGHGHARAVTILWLWTAILSAFVLYPAYTSKGDAVVPAGVAALGLALYTFFRPGIGRKAKTAPADMAAGEPAVVEPAVVEPVTAELAAIGPATVESATADSTIVESATIVGSATVESAIVESATIEQPAVEPDRAAPVTTELEALAPDPEPAAGATEPSPTGTAPVPPARTNMEPESGGDGPKVNASAVVRSSGRRAGPVNRRPPRRPRRS